MSKGVKIFAIVAILIAIIVLVSALSGKKSSDTEGALSSSVLPAGGTPNQNLNTEADTEFSELLSSVKSIAIDTSIFENPSFKALRDHPVILGTDTIGRTNPFAPIGTDAPSSTLVKIQTLQPGKITSTTAEFAAQLTINTTAPVSIAFQYGTTDAFGAITPPVSVSKGGTTLQSIKNLIPGTTYYVQAMAVVGSITTPGNIMTFTTAAAAAPRN